MDNNKPAQPPKDDRFESTLPGGDQFGEFEETGVGTDLTLEWDSNDPDLHAHIREFLAASKSVDIKEQTVAAGDDEDRYRHFREAGLPDA